MDGGRIRTIRVLAVLLGPGRWARSPLVRLLLPKSRPSPENAVLLSLLLPCALATSGHPHEMSVLGFDPVDRKVFASSFAETPVVYYLPVDGPRDWILVESWPRGPREWETTYERIEELKKRLEPLPEHSLVGLVLTESVQAIVPCPGVKEEGCLARQEHVTATLDGRSGAWTQISQGRSGALKAWELPTGDLLMLYSHIGQLYEGGYQTHRAEVLRASAP